MIGYLCSIEIDFGQSLFQLILETLPIQPHLWSWTTLPDNNCKAL